MARIFAFAVLAALCFPQMALAHGHHHRHHHHWRIRGSDPVAVGLGRGLIHMMESMPQSRPSDCYGIPWCGCWMRHVKGVVDKNYNLARNWAHWGYATIPGIGAVVVWPHHVGLITGGEPGHWIVTSGNDGHAVRTRARSLAGAIAFRD